MCAMMPMLRTLFRSVSTSCATGFLRKSCRRDGVRQGAGVLDHRHPDEAGDYQR
jgi:hypothetical protein